MVFAAAGMDLGRMGTLAAISMPRTRGVATTTKTCRRRCCWFRKATGS